MVSEMSKPTSSTIRLRDMYIIVEYKYLPMTVIENHFYIKNPILPSIRLVESMFSRYIYEFNKNHVYAFLRIKTSYKTKFGNLTFWCLAFPIITLQIT